MVQELYLKPAAAYVRGLCRSSQDFDLPSSLKEEPLPALALEKLEQICDIGRNAGVRLHRYKRSNILPRVQKVLGILHGLHPINLLDIGSGRGAFLWPLLDRFPLLPVTAIDASEQRAFQLQMAVTGGLDQLSVRQMDVSSMAFDDNEFDIVTALEVLEHIPRVHNALAETARVARRFVIVSVPSKEDNNPEHVHYFTEANMRQLFADVGIAQVNVEYVHNHMIVVAKINHART